MLRQVILIGLTAATSACGGGGGGDSGQSAAPATASAPAQPAPAARPYPQTDLQVAELVYSTGPRTPTGFYADPVPNGPSYVTTTHLKNTQIDAALAADAAVHEVCTDDWNQALEWSEAAARRLPSYGDLVATNSEPRYFEFVRVPRDAPSAQARQRVFRCNYLDRTDADTRTLDGPGGRVNRRPFAAADLRQLVEYLWHFTTFNNFGNTVLVSAPDATHGPLAHALTIATLRRASSPANCDHVDIVRWSHVATDTGSIMRSVATLGTLYARETAGQVALCEVP